MALAPVLEFEQGPGRPELVDVSLTVPERIERFAASQPETVGVYEGRLDDAADGIYVSPGALSREIGELGATVVEIELLPGAQLGAGDSHHDVTFGEVVLRVGEEERAVEVAIKTFDTGTGEAEHEHDSLIAVRQKGLDAFQPLAIAKDRNNLYLITAKRDEIESRDNADWTISPSDEEAFENIVRPELAFMSDVMAQLHAKGIFHGDAQPKNIAKTDTGRNVVMDLETAVIVEGDEAIIDTINGGGDVRDSKAMEDIWHSWYALIHQQTGSQTFMVGEDFETCMEVFENHVLDPYLESLRRHASPEILAGIDINAMRATVIEKVARTT
jgi:hypothetical protein